MLRKHMNKWQIFKAETPGCHIFSALADFVVLLVFALYCKVRIDSRCHFYGPISLKRKWAHKIGKLQEPPTRHSTFKCLVNTLYIGKINSTYRWLHKVNTYISGNKHGRLILHHKLLSENMNRFHWHGFFSSKIS